MRRRGLTLVEILTASAVLAAVLLPLLGLFSSTTGAAGDDMRKMEATNLALEIMDQVTHLHKRLGKLPGIPYPENGNALTPDGWLDLETYSARFMGEQGVPLLLDLSRCAWNSRLFLAPPRMGYRRALRIDVVETGPEYPLEHPRRRNFWGDALLQARVRVTYTMPLAGRDVERQVLLVSNFFQKCRSSAKFRNLE